MASIGKDHRAQLSTPAVPKPASPFAGADRLMAEITGMVMLSGRTVRLALTPPYAWTDEFAEVSYWILRRALLALAFGVFALGLGTGGIQAGNLLNILGSVDRLGTFFTSIGAREPAPWATGMVVAGVAGTAICADLGARKIRDEIDAMRVLGVDPIRQLVVPRFVALGLVTALLNMFALVVIAGAGLVATVVIQGDTIAGYLATMPSNFTTPELIGSALKTSMFGFIVAVVCCYKGLTATGGPEGVGRAVNQAVVISFVAIWTTNYLFTSMQLALFPQLLQVR
jgi:phospholipid/cholesterol/gamma-HCH transport system permease protein